MNKYAIYKNVENAYSVILPGSVVRVVDKEVTKFDGVEYVNYTIVTHNGGNWTVSEDELTFVNVEPADFKTSSKDAPALMDDSGRVA